MPVMRRGTAWRRTQRDTSSSSRISTGHLSVPVADGGTPADTGVSGIRFSSASVGWAFGPQLFRTGNGGKTWAQLTIPGHGHQVLALAATADGVYAVVSPCKQYATSCQATTTTSRWPG